MRTAYEDKLRLLSDRSVDKRFDAYRDVDWDAPEMRVDPDDPRWELEESEPLARTDWYRSLPAPARSRLGLRVVLHHLKVGVQFENILTRGLLELARTLPHDAPEVRYAYHEVIEESQHSLMFLELIRRSGMDVRGIHGIEWRMAQRVSKLGHRFPEMFFVHVLAGEAPIDHTQRRLLRRPRGALPPILRRIMQIHVIEEARHISFADAFLEKRVPRLGALRRLRLRIAAPLILGATRLQMMRLPHDVLCEHRVPRVVVRGLGRDAGARRRVLASIESVRQTCIRTGIVTAPMVPWWRVHGLWPAEEDGRPAALPASA